MSASKFNAKHTTVSAANQAALKSLKASAAKRPVAKFTAAERCEAEADAAKSFVDPAVDEAMKSYASAMEFKLPSGTRFLMSACAGILAYASTLWFGMPLVEWAIVGAVSLTGSAFLGWLVYVFGLVVLIASSVIAGVRAYHYIATFSIDDAAATGRNIRDAAKRKVSLVKGWFKRSDPADDAVVAA